MGDHLASTIFVFRKGDNSDARREKNLLTFLPFLFPKLFKAPGGSSQSPSIVIPFSRLVPLKAMHFFFSLAKILGKLGKFVSSTRISIIWYYIN